jgi:hypothetical protein
VSVEKKRGVGRFAVRWKDRSSERFDTYNLWNGQEGVDPLKGSLVERFDTCLFFLPPPDL